MSWHEGEGKAARIRVPRRRLYQRAVHALGGVTGERGENLRGIEDAIKGLGCRLVGAERCPPGTSAPRRGFLTENSPPDYFPIFLRLLTLLRP